MKEKKIAVASKDGISIDLHFGHAALFWVYEYQQGAFCLLEKRDVKKYCHGHTGSQSAMEIILETVQDCCAVFSAKIGDTPAEKLNRTGVTSVTDYPYEAITSALLDYAKRSNW